MIQISESAKAEICKFATDELAPGEWLRIRRAYQCGGSRFEICIDDTKTPLDKVVYVDHCQVLIDQVCYQLLDACELDFTSSGFVFLNDVGLSC